MKLTHAAETMNGLSVLVRDIPTGKATISRMLLDQPVSQGDYGIGFLVIIQSEITLIWLVRKTAIRCRLTAEREESLKTVLRFHRRPVGIH